MKLMSLVVASLLLLGATKAHAYWETNDVGVEVCTHTVVSVSSSVTNNGSSKLFSAELSGTTTTFPLVMGGRKTLEIQNIDMSTFTYVLCVIGLSSTSASGDFALTQPSSLTTSFGHMIMSQGSQPWKLHLSDKNSDGRVLIPYCVNNGGVTSAKVSITQCK